MTRSQDGTLNAIKEKFNETQVSLGNIEEISITHRNIIEKIVSQTTNIDHNFGETLEIVSGMSTTQEEMSGEIKKFSEILRGVVDEIEAKMDETNKLLTKKIDEFSELLKKQYRGSC